MEQGMVGNTGVGHELRQEVLSTQVMAVGQQAFLKKMQPRHSRHTSTKPPDSMEPELTNKIIKPAFQLLIITLQNLPVHFKYNLL